MFCTRVLCFLFSVLCFALVYCVLHLCIVFCICVLCFRFMYCVIVVCIVFSVQCIVFSFCVLCFALMGHRSLSQKSTNYKMQCKVHPESQVFQKQSIENI